MAESTPTPPQELPPRNAVIHNAAIAGAVLAPIAMMLPPRKVDIRFFVLTGIFSLSTNQLAYAYTGQSIYSRFGGRFSGVFGDGLPEGAKRTQQLLKEQRERQAAAEGKKAEESNKIKDLWMGGETEGWKERRAAEHRKAFEEGKGMSDLIMEQVAEVFSRDKKGGDDSKKD